MRFLAYFLVCFAAGCVLEDRAVAPDGGADGGPFCIDCPDDTPICNEPTGECVQCTPSESGECDGDTPFCGPALTCVACLGDADCRNPMAARCNEMNECAACTNGAQCDGVDGFPDSANACSDDGLCVECTPETEMTTCSNDVSCDPATNTCTETTRGSLEECESCVADSECGDEGVASGDFRCVPMFFPDLETPFPPEGGTGFCLRIFEPGGCRRPYAITISDRPSLSDTTLRSYCGINEALATCPAVRAMDDDDLCPGGDADCPESGLCRDVGGLPDQCTYRCTDATQCDRPPNPGSTCGPGDTGGDDFCGG